MSQHNRRNIIYVLVVSSVIAAFLTGERLLFSVSYLLLGVLTLSFFWAQIAIRWVRISRRSQTQHARVGKTIEEHFKVRNTAFVPKLWLEVKDHSNLPGHRASQVVPALSGFGEFKWETRTVCVSRGEFQLGPMTILSGDPFGLFIVPRKIDAITRLVVYPDIVAIKRFNLITGNTSGGEAKRQRSPNITPNVAGARDYTPGDSLTIMDWKATARYQRLMVKEFDLDPLMDVWLFADFSSRSLVEDPNVIRVNNHDGTKGPVLPTQPGIPASTEEYTAVITASLAQYFLDLDRAVGFSAHIPQRRVLQPDRTNRQMNHILESLGMARSLSEYTLDQMLAQETQYFTRGTTVILITSAPDSVWVARAKRLSQRGVKAMCVYIDPTTFNPLIRAEDVRRVLRASGIPTIAVRCGEDLAHALGQKSK